MASAPQIKLRDGSGFTTNLVLTTNRDAIFIEGETVGNIADIQVSINGAPFVSNPTLVKFDTPRFSVPNSANYPTGLLLDPGLNTLLIRTIDISGGVSASASVLITRVQASDIAKVDPPTGVRMRRSRGSVKVLASRPTVLTSSTGIPLDDTFRGFNVYASTSPAGSSGYFRINESLVTDSTSIYEEDSYQVAAESTTWVNSNQDQLRIRVTDVDTFGQELGVRLDTRYSIGDYHNDLRFKSTLEAVTLQEYLYFTHTRDSNVGTLNSDQFSGVLDTDPLYYVVTSVYFDPITGAEIESAYSQEVLGSPLVVDTNIRDLPGRNAFQVTTDFISAIQRANREISLIPGSTTRDVSIDPFASEAERLYFLMDYVHRCQSFLTLAQIDDANGDRVSDPVSSSAYKTALKSALGTSSDIVVQNLIDSAFDKLAGNVTKRRFPGRPSVGQVVFYTTTKPSFDLTVPTGSYVTTEADPTLGVPSIRFRVGGTYTLPAASAEAYYNYATKRYEITVDVVAETIGSAGNRPAGQIKSASGVSGLSVINTEATIFGSDRESNAELADRAMLALVSVDSGTAGGYTSTAIEQVGVLKNKIVKSGDSLMMRDYDPVRNKHIGGKVDIYIRGLKERQVQETFAFTFEIARDIVCQVIDLGTLTLRVLDSRVTPNTPLVEILSNLAQGFGVRNVTQGLDYDLTGVVILDYQTFRLNPALVTQPVTGVDDVITADYRFQAINSFTMTYQPVRRVVSVVGEVSGALDPELGYSLYKLEDPLLEGESTIASDHVVVNQVGGIPSGDTITVNNETHVLLGSVVEPLKSIGINTRTIRVFNETRTVEYAGPGTTIPDYALIEGTSTTPASIQRTANTTIPNGVTVSVDYVHDENFVVTYVCNDLLQELQRTINVKSHATADVLVKQAIQNPIEVETTVQMLRGATKDKVDPLIRTAVSQELNQKNIGQGTAQSDIIRSLDSTSGVDYLVVPFSKMAYVDGARKLREPVSSNYEIMTSLGTGGSTVYLLTSPLTYATIDGGGLPTEHKGVFENDVPLTLSPSLSAVGSSVAQAYIIGASGATILGYTDDATLVSEGFLDIDKRHTELLRRTANHVVLSLPSTRIPTDKAYTVSYVVRGDVGSKDIQASGVEYIDLGVLTLTMREGS